MKALAPWALSWIGRPPAGVALGRAHADDPVIDALELRGGQVGDDELIERLLAGTA